MESTHLLLASLYFRGKMCMQRRGDENEGRGIWGCRRLVLSTIVTPLVGYYSLFICIYVNLGICCKSSSMIASFFSFDRFGYAFSFVYISIIRRCQQLLASGVGWLSYVHKIIIFKCMDINSLLLICLWSNVASHGWWVAERWLSILRYQRY